MTANESRCYDRLLELRAHRAEGKPGYPQYRTPAPVYPQLGSMGTAKKVRLERAA